MSSLQQTDRFVHRVSERSVGTTLAKAKIVPIILECSIGTLLALARIMPIMPKEWAWQTKVLKAKYPLFILQSQIIA